MYIYLLLYKLLNGQCFHLESKGKKSQQTKQKNPPENNLNTKKNITEGKNSFL